MKFESSELYLSRRSPVPSRRGLVASSQTRATQAGLSVLRNGGTAADAAVAVAAALQVTQPCSTGLGGDCFFLYYEASSGRVHALNGSGRAPRALTLERALREAPGGTLPPFHPYTVTVPGAAAAWCDLVERFGRLELPSILAPAIELAEGGFPVSPLTARWWREGAQTQLSRTAHGAELMDPDGGPYPGTFMRLPNLAWSLRTLAEEGAEAFYRGLIAERIAEAVQEAGGVLTVEDLARHSSEWVEPISTLYRGTRVWECPPNGQGLAALIALNIINGTDVAALPPGGTARYHLLVEAMRLAFADAARYIGDPAQSDIPLSGLLSPAYAAERARLIDPKRAAPGVAAGDPGSVAGNDTVYFCVLDREGNGCSFINSNFMGFGTGIVPRGCGFSLQNRGRGFVLDAGHPNGLAPEKRPYHTIIPAIMTDGESGELRSLFGVMGGMMQPQGHLQVASALLDDGLDPQAALDRPRFQLADGNSRGPLLLEDSLSPSTVEGLAELGHRIEVLRGADRHLFGLGQVVYHAGDGLWWAGCDPRSDGCALAQD